MEKGVSQVDQTTSTVTASIDGNVEMGEAPALAAAPASNRIKITFNKPIAPVAPIAVPVTPVLDSPIDPSELQIQEIEPEPLPLMPRKPRLEGRHFNEYPVQQKGSELSGLCSIM